MNFSSLYLNPPPLRNILPSEVLNGIIQPSKLLLDNELSLHYFKSDSSDIVKIVFTIAAGIAFQEFPFVANLTNNGLIEGSKNKKGKEIANIFDFYGVQIRTYTDLNNAIISVNFLKKYTKEIIPLISEIVQDPAFRKEEIEVIFEQKIKELTIDSQKVKPIAIKKLQEMLFGSGNPLGVIGTIEDVNSINTKTLQDFYNKHYNNKLCIYSASNSSDLLLETLNSSIINKGKNHNAISIPSLKMLSSENKKEYIYKQDALQSAIAIGCKSISKTHPDFARLNVLITLLGGYFGSRLMNNLRENKAYTYGISAFTIDQCNLSYIMITTEVRSQITTEALKEIYYEINKLKNEIVNIEELERVKNYILGRFLRGMDSVYRQVDLWIDLQKFNMDFSYFQDYLSQIIETTPEDILKLANIYLQEDKLYEVVAGIKQ